MTMKLPTVIAGYFDADRLEGDSIAKLEITL